MPKSLPPFKITNLTTETITFQTSYPWAILVGANYHSPIRLYSLPHNLLNQTKLKILLPDYIFPIPAGLSLPPLPILRDYQEKDANSLTPLTKIGIFSEMRTGKTPLALRLFQN